MRPVESASSRPTGYRRREEGTSDTTVGFPPGSRAVDITPAGLLSAYTSRGSGAPPPPSTATPLDSSTSRPGSVTTEPPPVTRPFAISFSAARRDATPEWARYFASRIEPLSVAHAGPWLPSVPPMKPALLLVMLAALAGCGGDEDSGSTPTKGTSSPT